MNAHRLLLVVVCLLLDAALAYAGTRDRFDGASSRGLIEVTRGLLTVRVEGSPLQNVLEIVARESGVSIRVHATADETVTANLRGLPLDEGLRKILGTRSAVFVYADDLAGVGRPRLVEIHVYPGSALGADSSPSALPRPPAALRRPADSMEGVESGSGADGAPARAWRGAVDPPGSAGVAGLFDHTLAREQDPAARVRAAWALGKIGGDEVVAPLAASISADPDATVREAAALSLGKTWKEGAVAPLAQALLEDRRLSVREVAAEVLGETWSEAAVDALARALSTDPKRSVRENAADALGKIGSPVAVEVLIAALGDAHSTVRESAAAALGAIGSREALGILIQTSLTDQDPWVRQRAERAAAKILMAE